MRIDAKTWVVVADGERALVLENVGTAAHPDLRVISAEVQENPPTREQGTDRPGRYAGPGGRRESVEESDWHRFAKEAFARRLAARLDEAAAAGRFGSLILVAPPRTVGTLRDELSDRVRKTVAAEVAKDYTHHPVPEIERLLAAG